jgi:NitT/TauT family transport system substrate-binding protein
MLIAYLPGIIYSFHVDNISNMKGTTIARKQRKSIAVIPIIVTTIMLLSTTLTSNNSLFAFAQEQTSAQEVKTLRIGYFPNINHVQAVIGLGNGDFQKALGNNVKVEGS